MIKKRTSRILVRAGALKLEKAKWADDKDVAIEAEKFEVGQSAFVLDNDGNRIPLPKGEYPLDNGKTITTDELGIITNIK